MSSADIQRELDQAKIQDERYAEKAALEGKPAPLSMGSLLMTVMMGTKDLEALVCPVFTLRMRSSRGRVIADLVRETMLTWDDGQVDA